MSETTNPSSTRFEPGPATVVKCEPLAPNLQLLTVHAPAVAAKIEAGQFIILRADEHGERVPLTVADWDREAGTVSCVFMQVGTSTYKLGQLKEGDIVPTFVGPLGKAVEVLHAHPGICSPPGQVHGWMSRDLSVLGSMSR